MTRGGDHPPVVAVVGNTNGGTSDASRATGFKSGHKSATNPVTSPVFDPHEIHREFPARWQAYICANFTGLKHVMEVFSVSERTARKWWRGDTGANGGHVAIAVLEHPQTAPQMLFAIAAE